MKHIRIPNTNSIVQVRKVGIAAEADAADGDRLSTVAASFCEETEAKITKLEIDSRVALTEMDAVLVLFCEQASNTTCDEVFSKLAKIATELETARRATKETEAAKPSGYVPETGSATAPKTDGLPHRCIDG